MTCQNCGLALDPRQVAQTGRCPRCNYPVAMSQPQGQPTGPYSGPPGPQQMPGAPQPPGWAGPPPGYGPPQGFAPPPQPGYGPPMPRKRSGLPIIAIVLVVVVVLGVGGVFGVKALLGKASSAINNGLSSANQTATAAAGRSNPGAGSTPGSSGNNNGGGSGAGSGGSGPTPQGFKTYNDGTYKISYPGNWLATADQSHDVVIIGENNDEFWIWDGNQDYENPQSFDDILCATFAQPSANISMVTIDGLQWTREVCANSDNEAGVVEAVVYKGSTYALQYIGDASTFASEQQNIFGPMEQSFQFLI